MKNLIKICIVALLLVSNKQITQAHVIAESTFDVNDEGWEVYEGTTHYPSAIQWSATGGNPDGHVYSADPGDGAFYFKAPAKFLGDRSCAFNGTISWDLKTNTFTPGGSDMGLSIHGKDQQGGSIRILKYEHMNVINTWVRFVWTLNADSGWTFQDAGGNFSPASNTNIMQVLQNVTDIDIVGETIVGHTEVTHLDNVRITCGVPDEYKDDIKWSQPPVEINDANCVYFNGWDEVSDYNTGPIIADDWVCLDDRPIKDIHWWGSFKGWKEPNCVPPAEMPSAFHIGIWTDVPDPDPNDPNTFSHPGKLVWENICNCYVWSFAGYDMDPRGEDQDDACFKFDQLLSQDKWFYQDSNEPNGTIYWLSIAAIYDPCAPEPNYPWGWKTRPHFCKDDAVRITGLVGQWPPIIGSVWEGGEPIKYPSGTSWDMVFVLTTNRKYTPRKWHWPNEETNAADIYPDGIINLKDIAIMSSHWLEEAEWYPCGDDDC
jgi:hypothetical protein